MEKSRKSLWLLIITVIVLVLALGFTVVLAQEDEEPAAPEITTEEETTSPKPFSDRLARGFADFHRGMPDIDGGLEGITPHDELLAKALGIELEELHAAQESAHAAWLAEMVANGYMEQEQADLTLAYRAMSDQIDRQAIMASVLGLSEAELEAALEDGTRLSTLMEERGLTVDEFTAAMEAAYQYAVQALVPDVLTQDQADLILENDTSLRGFSRGIPGHGSGMPGPGGSRPGFHGHGSMRGFGGAQPGISGGLAPSDSGI